MSLKDWQIKELEKQHENYRTQWLLANSPIYAKWRLTNDIRGILQRARH